MALGNSFAEYGVQNSGSTSGNTPSEGKSDEYWGLERLKRSYTDYLNSKTDEVEEQKDSRRYRHASQWTSEQVKIFNKRKQPIVTYNRVGRKIDGVIGLVEKLKQSPKAFPRTPNEEASADLATAVVRSVLDEAEWKAKSYLAAQNAAVDGYGGVEMILEAGDQGDPQVTFEVIENDGFFYDPRSIRLDFSDCRYVGQGKWFDLDQAREMFPDHADKLEDAMESATELSTNSDREQKWFISDGNVKRVRIIDEWYIMNGEWCWCIYTGSMKLEEGRSYFHDEKGKGLCKYIMFSAAVDQDGDRYGFVRNLKSAQDEINQRRSKALHLLNTRRIIAEQGAFDDVEITRREAARPDGVVIRNKGFEAEFDDGAKNQEIQAHLEFLVDAKAEIENFGPNPALIGQGALGDKSGRAIQLLQQAGVAELGPFLLAYRGWKIRIYRAIWNAVREHWTAERYIRVTDDESVLQWVGINQPAVDPMTGQPAMQNHLANLDVDIIMDEGPDSITTMADTYDALIALAQNGTQIPPDVLLELAPGIDHDTKKRLIEKLNAPNPMQQLQLQGAQAEVAKTQADAELSKAKAIDTLRGDQGGGEHPAVTMAEVENKMADTGLKKAQAMKAMQEAFMAPQEAARDQYNQDADRQLGAYESERDARQSAYEGERDAGQSAYESERDHQQAASESDRDYQQSAYESERDSGREDRKLSIEERRMQFEREERQKDRDATREENERNRDFESTKSGTTRASSRREVATLADKITTVLEKVDKRLDKLSKQTAEISSDLGEVKEELNAPIKIERGPDGRARSVTKGKRKISLKRDGSGRLSGA